MDPYIDLFRHAKTPFNEQDLICGGGSDPMISQTGMEECFALEELLVKMGESLFYDRVFCANRRRTQCSADLLGLMGKRVPTQALVECKWGKYEGLPHSDSRVKEIFVKIRASADHRIPGGETVNEFTERIESFANPVFSTALKSSERFAFMTSQGVLRVILGKRYNVPYGEWYTIKVPNGALYRLFLNRGENPEESLMHLDIKKECWQPGFYPAE